MKMLKVGIFLSIDLTYFEIDYKLCPLIIPNMKHVTKYLDTSIHECEATNGTILLKMMKSGMKIAFTGWRQMVAIPNKTAETVIIVILFAYISVSIKLIIMINY